MRQQGLLELFTHNAGLSSLEFGYPKKKTGGKLRIRGNNDPRETTAQDPRTSTEPRSADAPISSMLVAPSIFLCNLHCKYCDESCSLMHFKNVKIQKNIPHD